MPCSRSGQSSKRPLVSSRSTDSMEHNNGRQGDMADQAAGNNEVHIQLRLKQTDAKILQAIDEALMRIEKGTFGVCRDCGEPIAEARLNAIPWTRVCITCKEKQKNSRRERTGPGRPGPRLLPRAPRAADAARRRRRHRHRLRHQQRLSIHHRPRGDAPVVAAARAARPRAPTRRPIRSRARRCRRRATTGSRSPPKTRAPTRSSSRSGGRTSRRSPTPVTRAC